MEQNRWQGASRAPTASTAGILAIGGPSGCQGVEEATLVPSVGVNFRPDGPAGRQTQIMRCAPAARPNGSLSWPSSPGRRLMKQCVSDDRSAINECLVENVCLSRSTARCRALVCVPLGCGSDNINEATSAELVQRHEQSCFRGG